MQNHISDLIQREMSRKEFLATLGVGLVSVLGLSTLLRLTGHSGQTKRSYGHGYGSSPYGR